MSVHVEFIMLWLRHVCVYMMQGHMRGVLWCGGGHLCLVCDKVSTQFWGSTKNSKSCSLIEPLLYNINNFLRRGRICTFCIFIKCISWPWSSSPLPWLFQPSTGSWFPTLLWHIVKIGFHQRLLSSSQISTGPPPVDIPHRSPNAGAKNKQPCYFMKGKANNGIFKNTIPVEWCCVWPCQ